MAISSKKLSLIISIIVLAVMIITFSCYILFNNTTGDLYGGYTNFSDFIEGTLWAYATIESGQILSDTFFYPYAIPFGANLLFAPFVRFFGIGLLANRLGMLLFFVILCFTLYYFSAAVDTDGWKKYSIMTLLLMSFSTQLAFNLLLHILYYSLGFVCMIGMLASIIWLKRSGNKKKHYITLLLFSLWGAANGLPSAALSVFPVLLALILSRGNIRRDHALQIVATSLVCGLLLYKLTMKGIHETDYLSRVGTYQLQSISTWFIHIKSLPETWFSLFISCNPKGVSIFQGTGIFVFLEIIFSLVITAAPLPYIVKYKRLNFNEIAVFHSAVFVWIVCLVQYVFLRSGGSKELYRLLFNCVLVNAMLAAVWYPHLQINWDKQKEVTIHAVAEVTAACMCAFVVLHNTGPVESALAKELQNRGFSHGYTTYWQANETTVLTNGQVQCCCVQVNERGLIPNFYNIDSSWYQYQEGDFFVALPENTLNILQENEDYWNRFFQNGAKDLFFADGCAVYVFDEHYWGILLAQ